MSAAADADRPDARSSGRLLERLYEVPDLPRWPLPARLERLHDGGLGFQRPVVCANFVASLDGVVALGGAHRDDGALISGGDEGDRFLMTLLRSCADVIVVGAGTLRDTPRGLWTAEELFPSAVSEFAELRRRLGCEPRPLFVVVSGSGAVDLDHPALGSGAIVAATATGAAALRRRGATVAIETLGTGRRLDMRRVLLWLRESGHATILIEGGPSLFGQLADGGCVDELFLTISPLLVGRTAAQPRPGFVAEADLLAEAPGRAELVSVRRHGSLLFCRYRMPVVAP